MIRKRLIQEKDGVKLYLADSTLSDKFSREELEAAFKQVQNPTHWKGPIDAMIECEDREVVAAAIEYFTGTEATFTDIVQVHGGMDGTRIWEEPALRVTAPGYWNGPCN